MLNFSDEMSIDTNGVMRIIQKTDGMYVVGHGMCIPVKDMEEANGIINALPNTEEDKSYGGS